MIPSEIAPADQAELWKPVLFRAAAALIFGVVTAFWGSPSVTGMGWAGGIYLLATGMILLWSLKKSAFRSDVSLLRTMSAAAYALAGLGVALLILQGEQLFGVIAAVALGLMGVTEIYFGITFRGRHVLARDWLISGVIGVGTALLLPFFISMGAHALLGVAGGGAIISGVLWTLAGLTLRHDARTPAAKAVN